MEGRLSRSLNWKNGSDQGHEGAPTADTATATELIGLAESESGVTIFGPEAFSNYLPFQIRPLDACNARRAASWPSLLPFFLLRLLETVPQAGA